MNLKPPGLQFTDTALNAFVDSINRLNDNAKTDIKQGVKAYGLPKANVPDADHGNESSAPGA